VIVLDTHAWLWWVSDPARLSKPVTAAIEDEGSVGVSAVSCWEVVTLAERGRIELDRDSRRWVRAALGLEGVRALPLGPEAAVAAGLLPREGFPGDPADRMIYATARIAGVRLATKDRALRRFDGAGTLW
jgi:PIN domain nuclease of toxin-antitoxin system